MKRDELLDWVHSPDNIKKYHALQDFKLMTDAGIDLWCIFQPAGVYESLIIYVVTGEKIADCMGECIIKEFRKAGYHGGYVPNHDSVKKYFIEWAQVINKQGS